MNVALVIEPTVQVSMIAAFASVIVALLGLLAEGMRRNHNALRAVKKDTRGTREQVENSHSTNLRDDIDLLAQLLEKQDTKSDAVLEAVTYLRRDVQQEREERLEADKANRDHIRVVAETTARVAAALAEREKHLDGNPDHDM